MTTTRH